MEDKTSKLQQNVIETDKNLMFNIWKANAGSSLETLGKPGVETADLI